jgi:hypothetical protein
MSRVMPDDAARHPTMTMHRFLTISHVYDHRSQTSFQDERFKAPFAQALE